MAKVTACLDLSEFKIYFALLPLSVLMPCLVITSVVIFTVDSSYSKCDYSS